LENETLQQNGSSSNHQGLDIAAPEGTNILAIESGIVTMTKFSGAGGYTVVVKHNENFSSCYCHVSPKFLVSVGQNVKKGQIIATVGPKYVYSILNNPYKDKNGIPTNRRYHRMSSSFWNKTKRKICKSASIFLNIFTILLQ